MLVVDGINKVNLNGGLVRIEVIRTGADGEQRSVEEIAIPVTKFGQVVAALQQAGQAIRQRIDQARESG
jgi:hypothetical protein